MTLEEKVGQMFFAICPDIEAVERVSTLHLGGYLLMTKDFKDAAGNWLTEEGFLEKIGRFQEAAAIPLLIGVDEEGGTVARASRNPNLFPAKFQSPQRVFAAGGMEAIREDAREKSAGLLRCGINVNFAPVADVSTSKGDFIYDRAFGQDAEATAAYVTAVLEEMNAAGIGSVLKHFPGYGSNVDTHTGIASDDRAYEEFVSQDFIPFQAGIDAGTGAVLVSHNIVACMDGELPASLSGEVHRVLREELGFEGVILTDDLSMRAVRSYVRDGSVAALAVQAGNDMLVTSAAKKQIPSLLEALEDGTLEEAAIDAAVRRILGWKYDLGLIK